MAQPSTKIQQEREFISRRITISRWLFERQKLHPEATGEFTTLMSDFVSAIKMIAMYVNKGPKMGVLGIEGSANQTGDVQKTLDVLTNDIVVKSMEWGGLVAALISEELDDMLTFTDATGHYLLCTDPLDGSSNIDVNVSVGTIFSILRRTKTGPVTEDEFLQCGDQQVAAGYVLYGPQTTLVMSDGNGVHGFTLDSDVGELFLSHPNMTIPPDTKEYAINCSRRRFWETGIRRYVEEAEQGKDGPRGKDFNMRWVGSMVADAHRILNRGGVFMYPGDTELYKKGIQGKLRVMYEINPMSFLMEKAGGAASTGRQRCMAYQPTKIHDKGPIIMGSKNEVERIERYHLEADAAEKK